MASTPHVYALGRQQPALTGGGDSAASTFSLGRERVLSESASAKGWHRNGGGAGSGHLRPGRRQKRVRFQRFTFFAQSGPAGSAIVGVDERPAEAEAHGSARPSKRPPGFCRTPNYRDARLRCGSRQTLPRREALRARVPLSIRESGDELTLKAAGGGGSQRTYPPENVTRQERKRRPRSALFV